MRQQLKTTARIILVIGCSCLSGTTSPVAADSPSSSLTIQSRLEIMDVESPKPNSLARTHTVCSVTGDTRATRQFINRVWKKYARTFQFKNWNNFGPDSGYRNIVLIREGQVLSLSSWHPTVEANKSVVVTSRGVEPLEDRDKAQVLKEDDPDYRQRREAFDAIVAQCAAREATSR